LFSLRHTRLEPLGKGTILLVAQEAPGELNQNAASRIMPRGLTRLLRARRLPRGSSA
jgi:hypothetical protein